MGEEDNVEQAVAKTKWLCGDLAKKTADKANDEGRGANRIAQCAGGILPALDHRPSEILGACLGNRGEKANFALPFSPNYAFQNHPRFFDFHPLVAAAHRGSARFVERPTAECARYTELAPACGARL